MTRTGIGYDVHRLVPDRPLILGGVRIPHERGLLGHSDADVLTHAIIDAVLGAAALGDIGLHYPDDDERFRGADSLELLRSAAALVRRHGFSIVNVDATVVLERPRLRPHIGQMRSTLALTLELDVDRVSVKATTSEGMGFIGLAEGAAAHAICTLEGGASPR